MVNENNVVRPPRRLRLDSIWCCGLRNSPFVFHFRDIFQPVGRWEEPRGQTRRVQIQSLLQQLFQYAGRVGIYLKTAQSGLATPSLIRPEHSYVFL